MMTMGPKLDSADRIGWAACRAYGVVTIKQIERELLLQCSQLDRNECADYALEWFVRNVGDGRLVPYHPIVGAYEENTDYDS
jgi:hypothetical protein